MSEYPRTLEAVESVELSLWPVVDALVDEVALKGGDRARDGEFERVALFLFENGYPSWSSARLRTLHSLGRWAERAPGARSKLSSYPVERVIEARKAANSDHERALQLLASIRSKRDLRPDRASPEQIVSGLQDEATRARVLASPGGLSAVERAHIDAHAQRARSTDAEVLPPPSKFGSAFWRLVQAADIAYEQLDRLGLG